MRTKLAATKQTLAATKEALKQQDKRLAALKPRAPSHLQSFGKGCLYTAYDQGFAPVAAYTTPAMRHYAELHGFDFVEYVDPKCDRPMAWVKIYLARRLFAEGYDHIFWVDADARICRFDEDIRDHLDLEHNFYFVREEFHDHGRTRLNSGVFLMRKSELTDRFLEAVLNRTEFTNHVWWEQAALLAEFGLWSNFDDDLRRNDTPNIFTSSLKFLPARWNRFMGIDADPEAIVHHCIALDKEAKVVALGIDTIFDRMGPRNAIREAQCRDAVSLLFSMMRQKG